MSGPSCDDVKALCQDLGFIDSAGHLMPLDRIQRMMVLVAAERILSVKISVEAAQPETFTSIENLTRYLAEPIIKPERSPPSLDERWARAMSFVEPYRNQTGVIGAYICGSATLPSAIAMSDLDLFVVFEDDAFQRLPTNERQRKVSSMLPSVGDVDVTCRPWQQMIELAQSPLDAVRAGYQYARTLFAIDGRLQSIINDIATLSPGEESLRLRVYYYQHLSCGYKSVKAMLAHDPTSARLLRDAALDSMRSMLFIAHHRYPIRRHCSVELRLAGVPEAIVRAWELALLDEMPRFDRLLPVIQDMLTRRGETFHLDHKSLFTWVHEAPEAVRAFERWAIRS